MNQTRIMSFIEANANAAIGLIVSWLFTYFALPLFGLEPSAGEAVVITFCYFILSVGRGYVIRRFFNKGAA